MRNEKKTKAEKAKTRHEQYKRASARKEARGLKRVTLWVSGAALEEAERRGLSRIGIIFAEQEADYPIALFRTKEGKIEGLSYTRSLFESAVAR